MTEEQIERRAEYLMDRLDWQLMSNQIDQIEYDREVKKLNKYIEDLYRTNPIKTQVRYETVSFEQEIYERTCKLR